MIRKTLAHLKAKADPNALTPLPETGRRRLTCSAERLPPSTPDAVTRGARQGIAWPVSRDGLEIGGTRVGFFEDEARSKQTMKLLGASALMALALATWSADPGREDPVEAAASVHAVTKATAGSDHHPDQRPGLWHVLLDPYPSQEQCRTLGIVHQWRQLHRGTAPGANGRAELHRKDWRSIHSRADRQRGSASHTLGIERYHIVVQSTDGTSGWLFGANILHPGTSHSVQTSGLIYGKDYSIHIRAKSVDGQWGPFVNGGAFEVREPVPLAVTGFIARYNGGNVNNTTVSTTGPQLDFTWNTVADPSGVERYHIVIQATDGSSGWLFGPNILHPGQSHSLQTSGLLDGKTYSYRIRAKNNLGNWGPFVLGGAFTVDVP